MKPEDLARLFHETYERLAPDHGYETRRDSAVPWEDVPAANKGLMIAVAGELLPMIGRQVRERVAAEIDNPSVWPDPFGHWSAKEADAARVMRGLILDKIARGES